MGHRARKAMCPAKEKYDLEWSRVMHEQRAALEELADTVRGFSARKLLQRCSDLSVLIWQAEQLDAWFQDVVLAWAQWLDVEHHAAPRKSHVRAREKILRSYKGKPECVLDFVRSCIIVERVADIQRVLMFVLDEAKVHVIKNRFDPSFDGEETFGYRDVNMQLTLPELEGTPCAGHVMEIQIHLRAIAALKTADGHKKYVHYRNTTGN